MQPHVDENPSCGVSIKASLTTMHRHLAGSAGRHAIVLPTTATTLDWAVEQVKNGTIHVVVGSFIRDGYSPAKLLTLLDSIPAKRSFRTIIFTDQLISPIDAPLLTSMNDELSFVSGVEWILNEAHNFSLYIWDVINFVTLAPVTHGGHILRLIRYHLQACKQLGDAWIMRLNQIERTPAERILNSRIRLRTFYSGPSIWN